VDDLWATKSEDVGLIVRAISFNLYGHDPPTLQTDTRHMRSQDRTLHYSASRGKNRLSTSVRSSISISCVDAV